MKAKLLSVFLCVCMLLQTGALAANIDHSQSQNPISGIDGAVSVTPPEYIFSVDGKKFILLDQDEGEYYVMAYDFYGGHAFDVDSTSQACKFDPNSENNIGYFLNHEFLESGNDGNILPDSVMQYIDMERNWTTEPLTSSTPSFSFTAGISLISQTELIYYAPKIGVADQAPSGTWGWWLRTKRSSTDTVLCAVCATVGSTGSTGPTKTGPLIRPVFYLKHDFFQNVKIELEPEIIETSAVRHAIVENYSREELEGAGYTQEELDALFAPFAPSVTQVQTVAGEKIVEGETLTVTYEYSDLTGLPEEGSQYQWYRSQQEEGDFSPIEGANEKTYTLTQEDVGMYIAGAVSASNGVMTAREVCSDNAIGPIVAGTPPVAGQAQIKEETLGVGAEITAAYTYEEENGYPEGESSFVWFAGDGPEGPFEEIAGQSLGTLTLTEAYVGKYIRFTVTPKSTAPAKNTGEPVDSQVKGPVISRQSLAAAALTQADRTNIVSVLKEFGDILDSRIASLSGAVLKTVGTRVLALADNGYDFDQYRTQIQKIISIALQPSGGGSSGGGGGGGGGGGSSITISRPNPSPLTPTVPQQTPQPTDDPTKTEEPSNGEFTDLDEALWAKDMIMDLAQKGYLSGVGDGKFAPNSRILFTEFVKLIVDSFGYYDESAICSYYDVKETQWVYPYVASAKKAGIVNGYSDSVFGVYREVTRQDMAAILYRVMQDKKVSLAEAKQDLHFTDESQIADYAVEAVRELTKMGILNGFEDGSFQPEEYVTRAMAAKVVYCLLELCQ